MLSTDLRAAIQRLLRDRAAAAEFGAVADALTAEHFDKQAAYDRDAARLKAALCGRRAGKSRGKNKGFLRRAMKTRGGRFLVINETRSEVRRINWIGVQGDGLASVVERERLPAELNASEMTVTFPEVDSIIACVGVDDEASIRKALGGAYNGVWWDEAQKIPPRFEQTIREVFMPTLLDFGGTFELTGSPSRQMAGLFYDVTRGDTRAAKGWSVHRWNLLDNPHFGAAVHVEGAWWARSKRGELEFGPYLTRDEAQAKASELRWRDGILDLQNLYGGPDVAALDSPIMLREGFGQWTHEDAAYVYAFHRGKQDRMFYARQRNRLDGFPDVLRCLYDLPGHGMYAWRNYTLALGVDLGYYPDPFAFTLWAWRHDSDHIYEVCSWRQTHLDTDAQAKVLRGIMAICTPAICVADAAGGGRPVVAGWSREWIDRYGIHFEEATKAHKYAPGGPIDNFNADLLSMVLDEDGTERPRMQLREGSPLAEELGQIQYARLVSATGVRVEDPSIPNDTADAALYAHRKAWHFRWREKPPKPAYGSPEQVAAEEAAMEQANVSPSEDDDLETYAPAAY